MSPNYEKSVDAFSEAKNRAHDALNNALLAAYPAGSMVYVVHSRGCFGAEVRGADQDGSRLIVKNAMTGKVSKWWYRQVEKRA